ncbi:MAG: hypothetical protein ABMA15_15280 [Vicinamibacterales bacterium]
MAGLSSRVLGALAASPRSKDEWASLLRVAVDADGPPMLGEHAVADGAIRFTPQFPLDPGREYQVRFNPGAVPSWDGDEAHVVTAMVGRPAAAVSPSTVVTRVYPSGDTVPANLLRMYIEFSAPMGRKSGIEHLTLLDHDGTEIPGAVLPLDYEFWSQDHQRFTVFFDPGRVKRGILPNQQMGRPLEAGRTVTLVVGAEWRDAQGQPLREGFRRQYRVTQPEESPLATSQWRLEAPTAGSRDAMAVSFPKSLDHGLLMRTLGVARDGQSIDGVVAVERAETRWTFTPKEPWRAGAYQLTALDILEDVAGNQIGRAFEVDNFDTVDKSPNPQTVSLRFDVR